MESTVKRTYAWIIQFRLCRLVLTLLAVMVPYVAASTWLNSQRGSALLDGAGRAVLTAMALGMYYLYVRVVEKRAVAELGLAGAGRELARGCAIGFLLFSLTISLLAWFGAYHADGWDRTALLLPALFSCLAGAVIEEVVIRGIFFRILEEATGSVIALLLSALVFGALHLTNPGATLLNASAIGLEAGVMLAAAFMLTRRLWLCIGIHLAWNFTQGAIFSVAVSGYQGRGLVTGTMSGPEWLSGGAFGAEASVVAVGSCMLAAYLFLRKAKRIGNVYPWAGVRGSV